MTLAADGVEYMNKCQYDELFDFPRYSQKPKAQPNRFVLIGSQYLKRGYVMAEPIFIVVPFVADGTSLHPVSPVRSRFEGYARAVAEQAALTYAGVAVIEQPPDEFAEPRLVEAIGRVPATMLDSLAA